MPLSDTKCGLVCKPRDESKGWKVKLWLVTSLGLIQKGMAVPSMGVVFTVG